MDFHFIVIPDPDWFIQKMRPNNFNHVYKKRVTWIGPLRTVELAAQGTEKESLVQNLTCTALARVNGFIFHPAEFVLQGGHC